MKKFLSILLVISCLGFTTKAQKLSDPVVYWSSDSTVTWAITVIKEEGSRFEINAVARAMKNKELTGIASMTIQPSDEYSTDVAFAKQIGSMGQIIITRKIYVKDRGSHSVSGQLSWYLKGETSVKNIDFTLPFEN